MAGDLLQIQQLGSITAAPNGYYVAHTVRSIIPDVDDDYQYQSEIWMAVADRSEAPKQMTYGREPLPD